MQNCLLQKTEKLPEGGSGPWSTPCCGGGGEDRREPGSPPGVSSEGWDGSLQSGVTMGREQVGQGVYKFKPLRDVGPARAWEL